MSDWISVKKYNPPLNVEIVLMLEKEDPKEIKVAIGYFESDGEFYYGETEEDIETTFDSGYKVIYWMNLPVIPKVES